MRRILAGRGDVTWRDWVPTAELPGLVASHDVCLGIFGDTDKALSVVPTKVYQGAAAGCASITSDTAPQRRGVGGRGRAGASGRAGGARASPAAPRDRPAGSCSARSRGRRAGFAPTLCSRFGRCVAEAPDRSDRASPWAPSAGGREVGRGRACRRWHPGPVALRRGVPRRRRSRSAHRARGRLRSGSSRGPAGDRATYVGVEPDARSCEVARLRIEPRGGTVIQGTDRDVEPGRPSTSCAPSRCWSTSRTTSRRSRMGSARPTRR